MKTIRVFTVEVSNCYNCPSHEYSTYNDTEVFHQCTESGSEDAFYQNRDAITPTCPRYGETIVKEVKE